MITCVPAGAALSDSTSTVGQALTQVELSIRDPRTKLLSPIGVAGEICARSPMNMLGYNDLPEATTQALDAEGWLHTGDLGSMDERGYVRVTGRVKEMIIRGGENLFPAEIENVLLEHPGIAEVAVVGLPDEKFGEIVGAFLRLNGDESFPSCQELIAFCRQRLSPQKTPSVWVRTERWPLTASGKIQKFMLREQYLQGAYAGQMLASQVGGAVSPRAGVP